MRFKANIILEHQNNQCQFCIEIDLDDEAEMSEIRSKTHKAMTALKVTINEALSIKELNTTSKPLAVPKQLPVDAASQGQIKYLNDLTSKCGTTLKHWCQDHGVEESKITAQHCKEWIPELWKKLKANVSEDDNFFLN